MNNQRKQIIILAVMGAVLLGVIIFQVVRLSSPGSPPGTTAQQTPRQQPAQVTQRAPGTTGTTVPVVEAPLDAPALQSLLAGLKKVPFEYPVNPGRDPMLPLSGTIDTGTIGPGPFSPIGGPPDRVVSAIIGNENLRYAVVDDEIVYPGYVFPDGTRVESVNLDSVTFTKDDKRINVPLKPLKE